MAVHVFPILTLPPTSLQFHPSGSSQCTSPEHPVSCIKPGLVIRFTNILYMFQCHPPKSSHPRPLPVVTLLWHRQTFPPLGFVALPCGIFQTVPSRDNPLFFSIFFPKDHGPSLSFPHQHISCKSRLHLLSLRLQQPEFFFF